MRRNMKKALVHYKTIYQDKYGEYGAGASSVILDCDNGLVTEDTITRWIEEIKVLESSPSCFDTCVCIVGFYKLD